MKHERPGYTFLARDRVGQQLGMGLVDSGEGWATVRMRVREDMSNSWGTCHGAIVAALADTAFAVACNSQDGQHVAAGYAIEFLAPALLHDELLARADVVTRRGRTGIYDVRVSADRDGEQLVIAEFRGRSREVLR